MSYNDIHRGLKKVEEIIAWVKDVKGNVDYGTFERECSEALSYALCGHHFAYCAAFSSLKGFLALQAACVLFRHPEVDDVNIRRLDAQAEVHALAWEFRKLPGAKEICSDNQDTEW